MDPLPYNITIPSQAGSILYAPTRDGNIEDGWNVTYTGGITNEVLLGGRQGVGTDNHQTTLDGATIQLSWIGTAIYLYGQAGNASFSIDVDVNVTIASTMVTIPPGGLLGKHIDLPYGNHTATLTTIGSGFVAFQYAELTVGVGYPGYVIFNAVS